MNVISGNRWYLLAAGLFGLSFCIPTDVTAHHGGTCYISKNSTHICYVKTGKATYAAAITDGSSVKPTVLAFACGDSWRGAGALDKETMSIIVSAICQDNPDTEEVLLTANN